MAVQSHSPHQFALSARRGSPRVPAGLARRSWLRLHPKTRHTSCKPTARGDLMKRPVLRSLETVHSDEAQRYLKLAGGDELNAAIAIAVDRNKLDGTARAPDDMEIHHALFLLRRAQGIERAQLRHHAFRAEKAASRARRSVTRLREIYGSVNGGVHRCELLCPNRTMVGRRVVDVLEIGFARLDAIFFITSASLSPRRPCAYDRARRIVRVRQLVADLRERQRPRRWRRRPTSQGFLRGVVIAAEVAARKRVQAGTWG